MSLTRLHMKHHVTAALAISVAALTATACTQQANDTTEVSLMLTAEGDQTLHRTQQSMTFQTTGGETHTVRYGDIMAAVVTIDEIYLQGGGNGNGNDNNSNNGNNSSGNNTSEDTTDNELEATDDSAPQGNGSRVILRSQPVTTDLLTLSDNVAELVDGVAVTSARYGQLRMVISGGYIAVDNGDGSSAVYATSSDYPGLPDGLSVDGELHMPSYDTSGLKVTLPQDQLDIEGEQQIILVSFDVTETFGREAGNSGRWVMDPSVKADNIEFTGTVTVVAQLDESQAEGEMALPVDEAGEVVGVYVGLTDAEGMQRLAPLVQAEGGQYVATFNFVNPNDGPFGVELVTDGVLTLDVAQELPMSVTLASGQSADVPLTITGVTQQ